MPRTLLPTTLLLIVLLSIAGPVAAGDEEFKHGHGVILEQMPDVEAWNWADRGGSVGQNDPVIFVEPDRAFPYRMYVHSAGGGQDLYKSKDMQSWEKIADDVIPSGGGTNFNWGRIGPDGRYYLYRTVNDDHTELWVGETLTDITNKGTVLDESDTGGYYDPETETWHTYYETIPTSGPCGEGIAHATSKDGVHWEKKGVILDFRDKPWHTGDPDVIKIDGTYHMFVDRTAPEHPRYHIAWATSENLHDFELRDQPITGWFGGDACVRYAPTEDTFFMYQEFHGENHGGVGFAEAQPEFRQEQ